jgi:hypothetical protein
MTQAFDYQVSLIHVPSGDTVVFTDTWYFPGYVRDDDWEYDPVFLWAEGNYSCNCNRDLFFHWNTGQKDYRHEDDSNCKDYDEYRVNWIKNLETGNVIHREEAARE